MAFLDKCDLSRTSEKMVAQLVGWLCRLGLFSYDKYLQRLTSRFDFAPENLFSEVFFFSFFPPFLL